jgi:hypothetical protein
LPGFVLAGAAAGLSDNTIRSDVLHLEHLRAWFGGPLWDMEPADADAYFGKALRDATKGTRPCRRCVAIAPVEVTPPIATVRKPGTVISSDSVADPPTIRPSTNAACSWPR